MGAPPTQYQGVKLEKTGLVNSLCQSVRIIIISFLCESKCHPLTDVASLAILS